MTRLVWLADVLREADLEVIELDGWKTRGADRIVVNGVVWHHTASNPKTPDRAVAELLRDGRGQPDPLAGPLSQLGLDRSGRYWTIAAGRANHNGYGHLGNDTVGIEAFNNGVGEPWPAVQLDAYDRGTAAILRKVKLGTAVMLGHKETDPTRKVDPRGIDMPAARKRVDKLLTTTPTPPQENDEMATEFVWFKDDRPASATVKPIAGTHLYAVTSGVTPSAGKPLIIGGTAVHVATDAWAIAAYISNGKVKAANVKTAPWGAKWFGGICFLDGPLAGL